MHLLRTTKLQTPESIALDFTLAGIGNRALALGVDYLVLSIGLTLLLLLFNLIAEPSIEALSRLNVDIDTVILWVVAITLVLLFAMYVGYFAISETLWQGQTIGKRWAKIRVIQDNGRPVTLAQSALRALLRPFDDVLMIGLCFVLFGQREKRIGDWVAGTLVIQEEQDFNAPIVLNPTTVAIAEQLRSQVNPEHLGADEIARLLAFLQRRSTMSAKAKVQISHQLTTEIRQHLDLETLPTDVSEEQWLEAIYHLWQQVTNVAP